MGNLSGRFFAWVKGGALPAAHATDVLATLWDQNAVLAATSPASAVLEEGGRPPAARCAAPA